MLATCVWTPLCIYINIFGGGSQLSFPVCHVCVYFLGGVFSIVCFLFASIACTIVVQPPCILVVSPLSVSCLPLFRVLSASRARSWTSHTVTSTTNASISGVPFCAHEGDHTDTLYQSVCACGSCSSLFFGPHLPTAAVPVTSLFTNSHPRTNRLFCILGLCAEMKCAFIFKPFSFLRSIRGRGFFYFL
mgnify:CR=1 FL=1